MIVVLTVGIAGTSQAEGVIHRKTGQRGGLDKFICGKKVNLTWPFGKQGKTRAVSKAAPYTLHGARNSVDAILK